MSDEISTTPVESTVVPVEPRQADVPNPVERSTPKEEPAPKADKPDLDTAVRRAFEKATADKAAKAEAEPKVEAKPETKEETPEAKAERLRAADGKFAAKEPKEPSAPAERAEGSGQDGEAKPRPSEGRDYTRPPAHFLPRAKEAWAGVNPDVQGEVHRMVQNYEKGISEFKEGHENWAKLKDFDAQAKAAGTTIPEYIRNVRAIEHLIQTNPVEGIRRVLATAGVTPEQYARHVLGQAQQQGQQPKGDPQLAGQLTQMQRIIQQQGQRIEQMAKDRELEAATARFIVPFRADHPRYDELEGDIAFFLNSGKIPSTLSEQERLEAAYDMAERINPAPKFGATREPGTQASIRQPDPAGQKSVTGAPSPGLATSRAPNKEDAKDLDAILRRSLAKASAR